MPDASGHRAEEYREIARELRLIAFKELAYDLCHRDQLLALAKGFDRAADREEESDRKPAAA